MRTSYLFFVPKDAVVAHNRRNRCHCLGKYFLTRSIGEMTKLRFYFVTLRETPETDIVHKNINKFKKGIEKNHFYVHSFVKDKRTKLR